MNEQLKQIKEQCWVEKQWDNEKQLWIDRHVDLNKFSELIVRECIERVRQQYIPVRDQTEKGKLNPFHPQLRLRTEREEGIVSCGVNSVIALEELIQEQTDRWYKENILGVEE